MNMKTRNLQLNRRESLNTVNRAAVVAACGRMVSSVMSAAPSGDNRGSKRASPISFYCDGRIHVGEPGQPEGKPLTQGHWDFKPSWYAYPRWIDGESAVVYHLSQTGKGQLYVYRLCRRRD